MRQYLLQTIMSSYYKKSFFGKNYMLFQDYYQQAYTLSNYCLALGYLYKDDIETLMELFAISNADLKSNIEGITAMAELIKKDLSNETKNIHDLFIETQVKKYVDIFYKDKNLDFTKIENLAKIKNDKIPLNVVVFLTEVMIYSLIGFGYKFPSFAEKLLSYKVDNVMHDLALKSGLNIPEKQQEMTIAEHLEFAKELIRPYAISYKPELLYKLGLN